MQRLLIATPAHRGMVHSSWVTGLLDTHIELAKRGVEARHEIVNNIGLLSWGRAALVEIFMSWGDLSITRRASREAGDGSLK